MTEQSGDRPSRGPGRPRARRIRDVGRDKRRALLITATAEILGAAAVLLGAYYLIPFQDAFVGQIGLVALGGAITVVVVNVLLLRRVSRAEFPQIESMEAVAVSLVVLLVAFSATYMILSASDANAFTEQLRHTSALYFAMTTLTTLGFGDISAKSDAARVAVMLQMVVDTVLLSIFVKLLVGTTKYRLSSSGPHRRSEGGDEGPT